LPGLFPGTFLSSWSRRFRHLWFPFSGFSVFDLTPVVRLTHAPDRFDTQFTLNVGLRERNSSLVSNSARSCWAGPKVKNGSNTAKSM